MVRVGVIIISIIISISVSNARILNVPDDFETIQGGIDAAEEGDTVLVQPDVYFENMTIAGKEITLASMLILTDDRDYIESTIIDGRRNGSVLTIGDSTGASLIKGFSICNGLAENGGGIFCESEENYWDWPYIRFESLEIYDNEARADGGGIYITGYRRCHFSTIRLQNNRAGGSGGGLLGWIVRLNDSEIRSNTAGVNGGGLFISHSAINRTIVSNNSAGEEGGGIYYYQGSFNYNQISVVENSAGDGQCGGIFFDCRNADGDGPGLLTNSLVYNNSSHNLESIWNNWIAISFSDIEGGLEGIIHDDESGPPEWLEGNIDADPLFLDPDNGDYRLTADSPCIDAGDPELLDLDGTRIDMGAFPHFQRTAFISGRVTDLMTGRPLMTAQVVVHRQNADILVSLTNRDGRWGAVTPLFENPLPVTVTVTIEDVYTPWTIESELRDGDSLFFGSEIGRSIITIDSDTIAVRLDCDETATIPITLRNIGTETAVWRATLRRGVVVGDRIGSIQSSFEVVSDEDNHTLRGVAFDGEHFYVSGNHYHNGEYDPLIYVLNRNGEPLDTLRLHGTNGFADMEWDGEWIWGGSGDSIYAINRDGETMRSFRGLNTFGLGRTQVAYDPADEVLWIHMPLSDSGLVAFDREGHRLNRTVSNFGLRISGLGWYADDPDGYFLHLVCYWDGEPNNTYSVVKMNPENGDTMTIATLDSATYRSGAFVCSNYDGHLNAVLVTTRGDLNIRTIRGQGIQILNLHTNTEWLTLEPSRWELAAGEEVRVPLRLRSFAEDNSWSFETGDYEGEIIIDPEEYGNSISIPVTLHIERNESESSNPSSPFTFHLSPPFPNPFNPSTTIRFSTGSINREATLKVYDLSGRLVADLLDSRTLPPSHSHTLLWNAEGLPGGIYLLRLESAGETRTMKAVLLR